MTRTAPPFCFGLSLASRTNLAIGSLTHPMLFTMFSCKILLCFYSCFCFCLSVLSGYSRSWGQFLCAYPISSHSNSSYAITFAILYLTLPQLTTRLILFVYTSYHLLILSVLYSWINFAYLDLLCGLVLERVERSNGPPR